MKTASFFCIEKLVEMVDIQSNVVFRSVCLSCIFEIKTWGFHSHHAAPKATSYITFYFEKQIKSFQFVSLQKRFRVYVYWKSLANEIASSPKVLLAEVGVTEYGDKENQELLARFSIKKETFPQFRLFKAGVKSTDPIALTDKYITLSTLNLFLKSNGVWIGLEGCIEEFDLLAKELMETQDRNTYDKLGEKGKQLLEKLSDEEQIQSANYYMKVMAHVVQEGKEYVRSELSRLQNMSSKQKNLNLEQLRWFRVRSNILSSFADTSVVAQKEEL
ncbi:endoplasmic reticulum protein 29 [Reticulomyxa filosa]|uniref:Endoplasmic reticulum protein 29 n=1 Tax=Reticulomyxa filosa TaxID=46433 RepID=X6M9Z0_RETFI|nr:endoplasmic reticulum protein 29 [Reticulomyxa filosa]|eukprot:ETO10714.1 endoplasmic reticulum protein 29 [Reticulomyxa filosa]